MNLDPVKVLKCVICQCDVKVNANYPVNEVTCQKCWSLKK